MVTVATAAPAFAVGSMFTLTATSPGPTFTTDQNSTSQALTVTLTDGDGAAVSARNILFTVAGDTPTSWLTLAPTAAVTNGSGMATTTLQYGSPKPPAGSRFTIMASLEDQPSVMTTFTLTYSPAVGNVVVSRVGTGGASLSSAATPVFLDTYSPSGTLLNTTPLPTAPAGGNQPLTLSGSATSEGALTRSGDGSILLIGGYGAPTGTAAVGSTTSAATPRVVGRIDAAGTVDVTTAASDAFSGGNMRSAAAANSGVDTWIAGNSSGIRYIAKGATTSSVVSSTSTNNRVVQVIGGQLYFSTGSGTAGVYQVGTGLPTTTGTTSVLLASAAGAYGFTLLNRSASVDGLDTLYVADDPAGIRKFSLVNGAWVANGVFLGTGSLGYRGLTGTIAPDGKVILFATTAAAATSVVKIEDTSDYNVAITATSSVLVPTVTNVAVRGVAFAPGA